MTQTQYTLDKIPLHFREPQYDEQFPDDIDRIQRILFDKGYTTTRQDIQLAWKCFSETLAANWIILPEDDEDVFYTIMGYLDVKVQSY